MSKNGRELPSRERGPPFYVAVNHVAVNHVNPVNIDDFFTIRCGKKDYGDVPNMNGVG